MPDPPDSRRRDHLTSPDEEIVVKVAAGAADDSTRMSIHTDAPAAPPPPTIRPLTRPFDIDVESGHLRSGSVTVKVGDPAALESPGAIVMVIGDAEGWHVLPTSIDTIAATATATWPHFSTGWLGIIDPHFTLIRDGASWSWQVVQNAGG
jgi:hypothetical protein